MDAELKAELKKKTKEAKKKRIEDIDNEVFWKQRELSCLQRDLIIHPGVETRWVQEEIVKLKGEIMELVREYHSKTGCDILPETMRPQAINYQAFQVFCETTQVFVNATQIFEHVFLLHADPRNK